MKITKNFIEIIICFSCYPKKSLFANE